MPLNAKGQKILANMQEQYGEEEGTRVLYASKNKGTISGIDSVITGATKPTMGEDQSSVQPSVTATAPSGMNTGIRSAPPLPGWALDKTAIPIRDLAKIAGADAWSEAARKAAAEARRGGETGHRGDRPGNEKERSKEQTSWQKEIGSNMQALVKARREGNAEEEGKIKKRLAELHNQ